MAMYLRGICTFVWLSSNQMLSFLSALLKCGSEGFKLVGDTDMGKVNAHLDWSGLEHIQLETKNETNPRKQSMSTEIIKILRE